MRSLALGGLITALAVIFLIFSQSKTAIGVMPLVFILAGFIGRSRRPMVGIALVVVILAAFNLFSVGTVIFEPVRKLVELVMPDATFTGRTEIWQLGVDAVARRPITGYGFSSFFGTDEVVYGLGENTTWANAATDAHNAYLNLALTIGLPGLLMTIVWVVVSADRWISIGVRRMPKRRRCNCCSCGYASTASIRRALKARSSSRSAKSGSSSWRRPSACATPRCARSERLDLDRHRVLL